MFNPKITSYSKLSYLEYDLDYYRRQLTMIKRLRQYIKAKNKSSPEEIQKLDDDYNYLKNLVKTLNKYKQNFDKYEKYNIYS